MCQFCNFKLGGKAFPNKKARIHLSGDASLRNGIVSTVCAVAPADIKKQFSLLVQTKRMELDLAKAKRKRKAELLKSTPQNFKQAKLQLSPGMLQDELVDEAWGRAFFALDLPANKIANPLFTGAVAATKRSSRGYKLPDRRKLYGPILDRLHSKCMTEQKAFLDDHTGYGRAVTGDGATILGTKFSNFLVHEHGKGVMLCKIKDCTDRLREVGSIEANYIAHEMIVSMYQVLLFVLISLFVFI